MIVQYRDALAALTLAAAFCFGNGGLAVQAETAESMSGGQQTTASQSENSEERQRRGERRQRWRQSVINRYVASGGKAELEDVQRYADIFGETTVYDPRYYHYKVKAEGVDGTTNSVRLSGEVYPQHYGHGVADVMEILGFEVVENSITALPDLQGLSPYGVSTTGVATLRGEPRRNAEQVNSVALGGWVRVLREGRDADISSRETGFARHAPGHDRLPEESPADWIFVQTMEGYLGFARKADFDFQDDYRLPDGMITLPVKLEDGGTTVPAGAFVYGGAEDGWKLFDGKKIPAEAAVVDLRPKFSAEEIQKLMEPFMDTPYVWGGVTDDGIDCSGFSQFFMRSTGSFIPRDSVQQATSGLLVAWGQDVLEKAEPGDLIFFARENGRISHVAISLGGSRIIHSAGRGVHIADLRDPKTNTDEAYGDGVLFARRVISR